MRHMQQHMSFPHMGLTLTKMAIERDVIALGMPPLMFLNDGRQEMEAWIRWGEMGDIHQLVEEDWVYGTHWVNTDDRFRNDHQYRAMRRKELADLTQGAA